MKSLTPRLAPFPVSYTHLDVYKRQVECGDIRLNGSVTCARLAAAIPIPSSLTSSTLPSMTRTRIDERACAWRNALSMRLAIAARAVASLAATRTSVSYTHLDVYKRQPQEWPAYTAPRAYNWNGFYVGAHTGGGFDRFNGVSKKSRCLLYTSRCV